ncbi:MAG TPA: hypothetical protein DCZ95_08880 [Verrucomicrobia bacterium]|nr:hypothetical protein [Verrucomicrobiota bacterium]
MFSLLFSPICILALVVTIKKPDQWHALLFTLAAAAFPQLWLYWFEIVLHEDRLSYRTLFSGRREILFADITRAKIEVGIGQGLKARTQPFYRLELSDRGRFARDPLIINMKPFSRSDLARVAQAIVRNAPSAKIDKPVVSLSQGSIKPLTRQAAKQIWKAAMLILVVFLVLGLIRAFITAAH